MSVVLKTVFPETHRDMYVPYCFKLSIIIEPLVPQRDSPHRDHQRGASRTQSNEIPHSTSLAPVSTHSSGGGDPQPNDVDVPTSAPTPNIRRGARNTNVLNVCLFTCEARGLLMRDRRDSDIISQSATYRRGTLARLCQWHRRMWWTAG